MMLLDGLERSLQSCIVLADLANSQRVEAENVYNYYVAYPPLKSRNAAGLKGEERILGTYLCLAGLKGEERILGTYLCLFNISLVFTANIQAMLSQGSPN